MTNLINIINESEFKMDHELQDTLRIINLEEGNVTPFLEKILMKATLKRIETLKNDSINLPTNLFDSYEVELIEDFLLNNEWSKSDINDANAYKGKYYIYDNTANEIRIYFFKQDGDLFVEMDNDLIQL